jgi:hypothetical protein
MRHYADSSFIVSCYLADANTSQANTYLTRTGAPLTITVLHILEIRNAFQLGIFRGLLADSEAAAAWKYLQRDLRRGRVKKATVNWPSTFRLAARLSKHHSAILGTRSIDILHIAAAKTLSRLTPSMR